MFVRKVSIRLKKEKHSEFSKILEQQILPVLRKQKGFKDELVLAVPGGQDVAAISLWETQQDAEAYNNSDYPGVVKALENLIEGPPKVGTPEIVHTTLYGPRVVTSAA